MAQWSWLLVSIVHIAATEGCGEGLQPRGCTTHTCVSVSEDVLRAHILYREFDEFHFMCAALLLPNCRDAFLRLSQLPSLRHSCVSASCQVFATGDFIRQSCLPRRKNASLQLFVELTILYIMYRTGKRPSGRMSLGRYIASRYVPLGRINSRGSAPGCRSAGARKRGWATASGRHRRA